MPVSLTNTVKQFDLKLVSAHKEEGAGKCDSTENALKDGNWWTFSGKSGWIIVDVGTAAPLVNFFSLHSTNPDAAVKTFKVEALVEPVTPAIVDSIDGKKYCEDHQEWRIVLEDKLDRAADPPVEYKLDPITARFWRVQFIDNFGAYWVGVNRISFGGMVKVFSSVLHGGVAEQHRSIICHNLSRVYRSGTPGTILLFGADAFPIFGALHENGKLGLETIAAAGSCIAPVGGKIICFAHNGFIVGPGFSKKLPENEEERQVVELISQVLRWCGNRIFGIELSIACLGGYQHHQMDSFRSHMKNYGVMVNFIFSGDSIDENDTRKALESGAHVLFFNCNNASQLICGPEDPRVVMLRSFIQRGGAFITGLCPWGWLQVSGGQADLRRNCLLNHVLCIGGMIYTDNYLSGGPIAVVPASCPTPSRCECLSPHLGESILALNEAQRFNGYVNSAALRSIYTGLHDLPSNIHSNIILDVQQSGRRYVNEIDNGSFAFCSLVNQSICRNSNTYPQCKFPINCGEGDAVKAQEAVQSAALTLNQVLSLLLSPEKCVSASGVEEFPGSVSPNSERSHKLLVKICTGLAGWQSTGLYIPSGECCTLELMCDQNLTSLPELPNLCVRIGCHTDRLHSKTLLNRWPDISLNFSWDPHPFISVNDSYTLCSPRSGCQIQIASPYGGQLYFEVSNEHKNTHQKVTWMNIAVSGAVKTIWYALDREPNIQYSNKELRDQESLLQLPRPNDLNVDHYDNSVDWKTRVKDSSAPWGELEGNFVIMSLPKECLVTIEDPIAVLRYWDAVIACELRLAHQKLIRKERLVCDCQISAGYMHNGYPVMTHTDICTSKNGQIPSIVNLPQLKSDGSWGIYHEFGHNRQDAAWTFDGAGEVTVNIFSLMCCKELLNQMPYETTWFKSEVKKCVSYIEDPQQTFQNKWQQDPGVALGAYAAFIQRYGFDIISRIFANYKQLVKAPTTDRDKINEWVKQTSLAVNRDLRCYYRMWKWPFEDAKLEDSCGSLPTEDWSTLVTELEQIE